MTFSLANVNGFHKSSLIMIYLTSNCLMLRWLRSRIIRNQYATVLIDQMHTSNTLLASIIAKSYYHINILPKRWFSTSSLLHAMHISPFLKNSRFESFRHFLLPGVACTTGLSHNPFTWRPLKDGKKRLRQKVVLCNHM